MASSGTVTFQAVADADHLLEMLDILDTALNPAAIATMLGAEVGPYLRQRAKNRFRNEGDDVVGQWSPLRPATQTIRASQGFGPDHPINRRTGALERYITQSPDAISLASWGATLRYPAQYPRGELRDKVTTAQKGRVKPNTVPRPVIGLNSRDLEFVLVAIAWHMTGKKGRVGTL